MSVQDNVKKIGQKLRELRKQKGFSQREVAAGVCSESAVSQIENGTYPSMPSATLLQGICDKLGVTLGNLLSEVHVDRESMENDVLIDIVKVLIHRGEYDHALLMIKEVQGRDSLLKYQRIEIGISLGDCFLKMGDFKQSIQVLTDLQQEVEADRETDDRVLATLHNKLGNAWYFASDMINAHNYYKRAFQASQRFPQSDQLSALILYNLGHVCMWLRIDHEAQTYLEQAVVLFEQFSDYKDLADALYVLGVLYKNMGDFMNAGIFIKKSLALFESLEVRDWALLAKHQYAFYILAEEDPREAISELLRTVSEYQQLGEIQKIPYLRARISFLYLGLGEVYKAKSFIESA
ncbi:MAG TPA: helix-turn-helix transcriptional regulator, partial [Bacilli bacterium]|nr:helix-turn-helix transcriptional regulator [Bacilli bacterium]